MRAAWAAEPTGGSTNTVNTSALIGLSFSTAYHDSPGPVNEAIACTIAQSIACGDINQPVQLVLQQEVADAFDDLATGITVNYVVCGTPSNTLGGGIDSWDVLQAAKQYWRNEHAETTALFGQARHVGRVACQYEQLFGSRPIIPANLPDTYDPESPQWWTRTPTLWRVRETVGALALSVQGKL